MSQPEFDFLDNKERREMRRYLSFPEEFPKEFREWLKDWMSVNGEFTKSNIDGLFGEFSDASVAISAQQSDINALQVSVASLSSVNGTQGTDITNQGAAVSAISALSAYAQQAITASTSTTASAALDGPAVTGLAAGTWIVHYRATLAASAGTAQFSVTQGGVGQLGDKLKTLSADEVPMSSFAVLSTTGNGSVAALYETGAGTATFTHRAIFAHRIA